MPDKVNVTIPNSSTQTPLDKAIIVEVTKVTVEKGFGAVGKVFKRIEKRKKVERKEESEMKKKIKQVNMTIKNILLNTIRLIFKIKAIEKLLVKMNMGEEYGRFWTKFTPLPFQYEVGSKRKVKRESIYFEFDISDLFDWWNYFGFKTQTETTF